MKIVQVLCAESNILPPITALGYEYVLAGNGLFIRAEDSRLEALVPIAYATLHGCAAVEPYARLKVPRISDRFLHSVLMSARQHLPNEALYQFSYNRAAEQFGSTWRCAMPSQHVTAVSVEFGDTPAAVLDLHSHNTMDAFFSSTDDADEQGLRFYAVIGKLDTELPEIALRVGVYGHHWNVPVETVFDGSGPFDDVYGRSDDELIEHIEAADQAEILEEEFDGHSDPFHNPD